MAEDWDAFLEAYSALKKKYEALDTFTGYILGKYSGWAEVPVEHWADYYEITGREIELEELKEEHGESISNS